MLRRSVSPSAAGERALLMEIQTTKDAIEFYNGKIEELGTNLKDLEGIIQGKSNNLRVVEEGRHTPPMLVLFYLRAVVADRRCLQFYGKRFSVVVAVVIAEDQLAS
jgi:hypothetical protein